MQAIAETKRKRGRPRKEKGFGPKGISCAGLLNMVFLDNGGKTPLYFSLHTVSEGTHDKIVGLVKNHILPFFKPYQVSEISIGEISEFRRFLVEKKLSSKSQSDIYSYAKAAFGMAPDIDLEHVKRNAFESRSLTPIRKDPVSLTRTPSFTPEEIRSLFSHAWKNPLVQALATFILYTGCRVNEACALVYEDFEMIEDGVEVSVKRNYSPGYGMKGTKTEAGHRKVVIPRYVFDFIYPAITWAPGRLVFSLDGKRVMNYYYRSRWFYEEMEKSGIPRQGGEGEDRTMYSLRPFYKSYTSGCLPAELSNYVMGHRDQSMGSHYWHYQRSSHAPILIKAVEGLLKLDFPIFSC